MTTQPKQIPPPGFVAKLPPVGKVFTDPTKPPGFGWRWSDHATPPRWLPPDASSPYFQQAIADAWYKAHESSPSPLPHLLSAPDQTGQDRGQGEGDALLPNQCSHCGIIVEGMSMAVHTCYVCDVDAPPFRPVKSTTAPHQPDPTPQSAVEQGDGESVPPTQHELKTWPQYFMAVKSGEKTFELRRNDRHYRVGDTLWLREWSPITADYTGSEIHMEVIYLMESDHLMPGYCAMSIRPLRKPAPESAEQWTKARIVPESAGPAEWVPEHLPSPDALTLARRCDEAEQQVKRYDEYHSKLITENESLRAQLAAAQAELTRLQHENTAHRVAWKNAEQRERELREALEWLEDEAPFIVDDAWTNSVDMAGNRWTLRVRIDGPTQKFRGRTLIETIQKARYAAALAKKEVQS